MQHSNPRRTFLVEEGSDLSDNDTTDLNELTPPYPYRLEVEDSDTKYNNPNIQENTRFRKSSSLPFNNRYRLEVGGNKTYNQSDSMPCQQTFGQTVPIINKDNSSLFTTNNDSMAMEIDEIEAVKTPLIVMDGANIAHAYSEACGLSEPNSDGILLAVNYFLAVDVSVTVVLPTYWMRSKPRISDQSGGKYSSGKITAILTLYI